MDKLKKILENGLLEFQEQQDGVLDISLSQIKKLIDYILLLHKWNKVHNLTGIRSLTNMIYYIILDSISAYDFVKKQKLVLDVGTGPGIPGLVLAIILPGTNFILVDSNKKKLKFVQHVVTCLQLANVQVFHERIEKFVFDQKFPLIISKAFSSLDSFIEKTSHLCADNGLFLSFKGEDVQAQVEKIPLTYSLASIKDFKIPGINSRRSIVLVKKKT